MTAAQFAVAAVLAALLTLAGGASPARAAATAPDALRADLAAYDQAVQDAVTAHNAAFTRAAAGPQAQQLEAEIARHELLKSHIVWIENDLRGAIAVVYDPPGPPLALAARLAAQAAAAVPYTDVAGKWAAGAADAATIERRFLGPDAAPAFPGRRWNGDVRAMPPTAGTLPAAERVAQDAEAANDPYQTLTPPGGDLLNVVLQHYIEALRREAYWGAMRRGDGQKTGATSVALWNELIAAAPECLEGPLPVTQANIAARPQLFDVSPACDHRTWSRGPEAGQPIPATELGGADAALWALKAAAAEEQTGPSEQTLIARAQALAAQGIGDEARRRGLAEAAQRYDADSALLSRVQADPNDGHLVFPPQS